MAKVADTALLPTEKTPARNPSIGDIYLLQKQNEYLKAKHRDWKIWFTSLDIAYIDQDSSFKSFGYRVRDKELVTRLKAEKESFL